MNPIPPAQLPTTGRSVGRASHDAAAQADIAAARRQGATDFRLNQQQVNAAGERVGINRPDLQYTLNGQRFYIEYEGSPPVRGEEHNTRILANDPSGSVVIREIP